MTDVTRLLKNSVEATTIVQHFVLSLVEHVVWKKKRKKKVKVASIYRASHKPG